MPRTPVNEILLGYRSDKEVQQFYKDLIAKGISKDNFDAKTRQLNGATVVYFKTNNTQFSAEMEKVGDNTHWYLKHNGQELSHSNHKSSGHDNYVIFSYDPEVMNSNPNVGTVENANNGNPRPK